MSRILVVGGNGFVGSAVCKAALARGIRVTSISASGTPFRTPKGHTPAWVAKVDWRKADAFRPETYSDLLPNVAAVVHTLGTLLEDGGYKAALSHGNVMRLVAAIAGVGSNPLERKHGYQAMNCDSALRVCEAFVSSKADRTTGVARPFVFVSAEDIFRPLIPAAYIESKREAEQRLSELLGRDPGYRGVFVRPSLVYHAHYRPLTSPLAALIDLSATLQSSVPKGVPTPSSLLRLVGDALPSSHRPSVHSIANALSIPPIHVDHVAEAICIALDPARDISGVVGVREMRDLIGCHDGHFGRA